MQLTVFQGDSVVRHVRLDGLDMNLAGATARERVVREDGTEAMTVRDISAQKVTDSEGNTVFEAVLDQTDTDALGVGIFNWIVEITTNETTPDTVREVHRGLRVKTPGIPT